MILPPSAGVIGWPVAHSKSPLIHRFWLSKLGIDGDYGRFPVHPDNLGTAIRALQALGLRGVNVTVPHKVAVMAHLDRIDPVAERIGAVNTVITGDGELTGFNTDAAGFLDPLDAQTQCFQTVVVIGAGGAARAVIAAVIDAGVKDIIVVNRSAGKAIALMDEFPALGCTEILYPGLRVTPCDLLVNATSLGMAGQPPLDIVLDDLDLSTIVYDIVYSPLETPLLAAARARGVPTIDGLQMLVGQAAAAFELFFGQPAPRQHDAELRALLTV